MQTCLKESISGEQPRVTIMAHTKDTMEEKCSPLLFAGLKKRKEKKRSLGKKRIDAATTTRTSKLPYNTFLVSGLGTGHGL